MSTSFLVFIFLVSSIQLASCALQMPLREAALSRGILMGSATGMSKLNNTEYDDVITAGNECKFTATEPQYNVFNFNDCSYVYNFAVEHNQLFRGHNLCWGQYNPNWLLNGNYSQKQLESILENHINTVIQHYLSEYNESFISWDVVNEAINDPPFLNETNIYKTNIWYPSLPNYVELAFGFASKASNGSNVKLFSNDFNITMDTGYTEEKANYVYEMIKNLKQKGIRIDGIGIEAHMNMGEYDAITNNYKSIVRNMQRFADLGLEVQITEMDIMCGQYTNNVLVPCKNFTQQIATKQAEMYQTMLKACLEIDECKNFETWGFTDKYSWRGSDEYPLPFDTDYNPKLAAYYLENQLLNKTK